MIKITDEGVKHMVNMKKLDISSSGITDNGIINMVNLEKLNISGCQDIQMMLLKI